MQPTHKFRKPLLACALLIGAGNTFIASAETFTVTASAIPDVDVQTVVGTQISFGSGVIGTKVSESCILPGTSHVDEGDLKLDHNGDGTVDNVGNLVTAAPITGSACVPGTTGEVVVLEIDGADTATVSVTVNDVIGTGWTYSPGTTTCVSNYDRGSEAADTCDPLVSNTLGGIQMSNTQTGTEGGVDATGTNEVPDGDRTWPSISGKTRMILAGTLTIDSEIPANTTATDNIIVQVTYE